MAEEQGIEMTEAEGAERLAKIKAAMDASPLIAKKASDTTLGLQSDGFDYAAAWEEQNKVTADYQRLNFWANYCAYPDEFFVSKKYLDNPIEDRPLKEALAVAGQPRLYQAIKENNILADMIKCMGGHISEAEQEKRLEEFRSIPLDGDRPSDFIHIFKQLPAELQQQILGSQSGVPLLLPVDCGELNAKIIDTVGQDAKEILGGEYETEDVNLKSDVAAAMAERNVRINDFCDNFIASLTTKTLSDDQKLELRKLLKEFGASRAGDKFADGLNLDGADGTNIAAENVLGNFVTATYRSRGMKDASMNLNRFLCDLGYTCDEIKKISVKNGVEEKGFYDALSDISDEYIGAFEEINPGNKQAKNNVKNEQQQQQPGEALAKRKQQQIEQTLKANAGNKTGKLSIAPPYRALSEFYANAKAIAALMFANCTRDSLVKCYLEARKHFKEWDKYVEDTARENMKAAKEKDLGRDVGISSFWATIVKSGIMNENRYTEQEKTGYAADIDKYNDDLVNLIESIRDTESPEDIDEAKERKAADIEAKFKETDTPLKPLAYSMEGKGLGIMLNLASVERLKKEVFGKLSESNQKQLDAMIEGFKKLTTNEERKAFVSNEKTVLALTFISSELMVKESSERTKEDEQTEQKPETEKLSETAVPEMPLKDSKTQEDSEMDDRLNELAGVGITGDAAKEEIERQDRDAAEKIASEEAAAKKKAAEIEYEKNRKSYDDEGLDEAEAAAEKEKLSSVTVKPTNYTEYYNRLRADGMNKDAANKQTRQAMIKEFGVEGTSVFMELVRSFENHDEAAARELFADAMKEHNANKLSKQADVEPAATGNKGSEFPPK